MRVAVNRQFWVSCKRASFGVGTGMGLCCSGACVFSLLIPQRGKKKEKRNATEVNGAVT